MLLGVLGVRQQPLKESVAKAVGCGWKICLRCLPIPVEEVESNKEKLTLNHRKTGTLFYELPGLPGRHCKLEHLTCHPPHTYWTTLSFCDHMLILCSPPHCVAIELKELEDILCSLSEFFFLLGSQGIIGCQH